MCWRKRWIIIWAGTCIGTRVSKGRRLEINKSPKQNFDSAIDKLAGYESQGFQIALVAWAAAFFAKTA
jgi:hypothetical protein